MADEHGNALAHELPEERELMLEVEAIDQTDELSESPAPDGPAAERGEPDPVRLYLRQAARSRLLQRDEEVAIARRIDDARCERVVAVLGSPLGLRWVLRLPAAERDGSLDLLDVLVDRAEGEEPED